TACRCRPAAWRARPRCACDPSWKCRCRCPLGHLSDWGKAALLPLGPTVSKQFRTVTNCCDSLPLRQGTDLARILFGVDRVMNPLRPIHRHLDPADTLGELIFGIIMVLTFTIGARLLGPEEPLDSRELLVAAIGCNIAWGIIDGFLYLLGCV